MEGKAPGVVSIRVFGSGWLLLLLAAIVNDEHYRLKQPVGCGLVGLVWLKGSCY